MKLCVIKIDIEHSTTMEPVSLRICVFFYKVHMCAMCNVYVHMHVDDRESPQCYPWDDVTQQPRFTTETRLAGHWGSGIVLSLPPQCCDDLWTLGTNSGPHVSKGNILPTLSGPVIHVFLVTVFFMRPTRWLSSLAKLVIPLNIAESLEGEKSFSSIVYIKKYSP